MLVYVISGQFDTVDNLTPRTIRHRGQFDTAHVGRQFDTGQFDTKDNLTPG